MIRALIGRIILSCLDAAGERAHRAIVHGIDLDRATDAQISDWLHGRKIDLTPPVATLIPFRKRTGVP
ncbi:MAG: hypothetical protein HIU82_02290 [Proteobacteria bacterium]|nr:hypothetical protein [Pseudomonadota bacterium]